MPIIFEKQITPAKKLAVWQITEPLDFFLEKLGLHPDGNLSIKRQLENAVCAVLLNELAGPDIHLQLSRDEFGKPFVRDSDYGISFSHSRDMVACVADAEGRSAGIDIELIRESILGLSKKFIKREDSSPFTGFLHCHMIWGAKEVLYKVYAKKELDFICHLTVKFDKNFTGTINKNGISRTYPLDFIMLNNFILIWNI
jgi:4'-phosphopantetheinyl transferase